MYLVYQLLDHQMAKFVIRLWQWNLIVSSKYLVVLCFFSLILILCPSIYAVTDNLGLELS